MAFYVYILRCADGSYYTGHTDNLEQRLAAHQNGEIEGHTRTRRPVTLVFSDRFDSRQDAFERERQLKGWSRAKKAGPFGFPHVIASAAWQSRRRSNDGSPARAQPQRDCHVAALLAMTTE